MAQYERTIIDLIGSSARNFKALPLNLGAVQGSGGGVGAPPGGYIGWLPQTRVAYDTEESASLATSVSGSVLDNLNHIRYRLNILESGGSIIVTDDNNSLSYLDTTDLHFVGSGVVVTDLGGGEVQIEINATGSGGGSGITQAAADARYLKLDASNDPLTSQLDITPSTPGDGGIYISTAGDAFPLDVEQITTNTNVTSPNSLLIQYTDGTGNFNFNSQLIHGLRYKLGTGSYNSSWIKLETVSSGVAFDVANNGTVNIPTGSTYNINGTPHNHGTTPAFTVSNAVTDRTFDANSTSIDELADILGTLIQDLKNLGIVG
jgi:hypothetical protein